MTDIAIEPATWNAHQASRLVEQRGTHIYFAQVHQGVMNAMSAEEMAERYNGEVEIDFVFCCYRDGEAYEPVVAALRYCAEKLNVCAPLLALAYTETPNQHIAKHLCALSKVLVQHDVLQYVGDCPALPGFATMQREVLYALATGQEMEDDREAVEGDGPDQEGGTRDDHGGGVGGHRVQGQRVARVAVEARVPEADDERGWADRLVDRLGRLPRPLKKAAQSCLLGVESLLNKFIEGVAFLQDVYDALEDT